MKVEFELFNKKFPEDLGVITLYRYYPKRFTVDSDYEEIRQAVYRFKDGHEIDEIDTFFYTLIEDVKKKRGAENLWLCPIPASNTITNKIRFQDFISRLAVASNVNNGFTLIRPKTERDRIHSGESRDYSKVIESLSFEDFFGKDVILCDDVMTTGKSFRIIADHLKTLGAKTVVGIIMAKTYWLEE